ncbi:Adenosine deaminase-like protein [Nymphaea thermarum]|nr:Adenosine deaminase-like protein [Nymphaea thermarum]
MVEDGGRVDMEWCIAQPKIELHAHLNGSIRDSTLLELAKDSREKGALAFSDVEHVIKKCTRSVMECFKLFDVIRIITTDHAALSRITKEVIEDFAADNVVYLELRTTPKKNEQIGMTKCSYMEAVLDGMRAIETVEVSFLPSCGNKEKLEQFPNTNVAINGEKRRKLYVRLLLSIDRCESAASAMETVQLAYKMRHLGVVGVDLSGNPLVGEWLTFLPALKWAKEHGLAITLHCGEVYNPNEIKAMLEFCPQRVGHACWFEQEDWTKLKSLNIPVEVCLSSNVQTCRVSSIRDHHFDYLYRNNLPLVLCTDDSGVFSTNLSREYYLAASTFGLDKAQMFELSRNAIKHVFADESVKILLNSIFDSAQRELAIAVGSCNS